MTGLFTKVWCGLFVHGVEQLAGMCHFHFWEPADVLTDVWYRHAACLPTMKPGEMERLFLSKPIKKHLMKISYICPPVCFWQPVLIWNRTFTGRRRLQNRALKELISWTVWKFPDTPLLGCDFCLLERGKQSNLRCIEVWTPKSLNRFT